MADHGGPNQGLLERRPVTEAVETGCRLLALGQLAGRVLGQQGPPRDAVHALDHDEEGVGLGLGVEGVQFCVERGGAGGVALRPEPAVGHLPAVQLGQVVLQRRDLLGELAVADDRHRAARTRRTGLQVRQLFGSHEAITSTSSWVPGART